MAEYAFLRQLGHLCFKTRGIPPPPCEGFGFYRGISRDNILYIKLIMIILIVKFLKGMIITWLILLSLSCKTLIIRT
jgi:hypothetical protein